MLEYASDSTHDRTGSFGDRAAPRFAAFRAVPRYAAQILIASAMAAAVDSGNADPARASSVARFDIGLPGNNVPPNSIRMV